MGCHGDLIKRKSTPQDASSTQKTDCPEAYNQQQADAANDTGGLVITLLVQLSIHKYADDEPYNHHPDEPPYFAPFQTFQVVRSS